MPPPLPKKAVPPPRPVPTSLLMPSRFNDDLFWAGFKRAAGVHAALALFAMIAGVVIPHEPIKFLPSIRVDLVALPDFKKSELIDIGKSPTQSQKSEEKTPVKTKSAAAEKKPGPPKLPDNEMALKKLKSGGKAKAKGVNLDDAIKQIKALEKIENDVNGRKNSTAPKTQVAIVKGNKVAKGDSLTGGIGIDKNEFISRMRAKLQDNWNLPVWLTNKDLAARVLVFLDATGFVNNLVVTKSSGNQQFDDFCVKTIRMAQPFGAPPDNLVNEGIVLGFPL